MTFKTSTLVILLSAISGLMIAPKTYAQTLEDGPAISVTGGTVHTISRGRRGALLIGGDFSQVQGVTRNRVSIVRPDGSLEPMFNPNLSNGVVLDSIAHSSGDFFFVGSFTSPHTRIARYYFDGEVVPGFGFSINATVRAIVEDPATARVYIGGDFTQVGSAARSRVARLNENGSADPGFVPVEFSGAVRALAVQADGKLIVAGNIQRVGDIAARRLYRLNTDGSWDSSFSVTNLVGAPHEIRSVAVQPDGRILVGGDFPGHLRRYNADGSLDTTYQPPALNNTVYSIDLQPDGRAIIGGDFTGVEGRLRVIRLHESGALDTSFSTVPSPGAAVRTVEVHSAGGVFIGGDFTQLADPNRNRVARLDYQGQIDRDLRLISIDPDNFSHISALAEAPDGLLYVGGNFTRLGGVNRTHLARVREGGTVDSTFQPTLNNFVNALQVQADGRLLVAGGFGQVNGVPRRRIARLNPDGSLDESFANGLGSANGAVLALELQADGQLLAAGTIERPGTSVRGIVRLNPNGTHDSSFAAPHFDGPIRSIAIDHNGRIVVGGNFNSIGGTNQRKMARLLSDGTLDLGFTPQFSSDSDIRVLARRNDRILAGGNFFQINGSACERMALINADGTTELCANNVGFGVHSIAIRADGRMYAAGRQTLGSNSWGRLALYNANLTPVSAFGMLQTPVNSEEELALIRSLLIQSDGRLALAGGFDTFEDLPRGGLARLRLSDDIEQSLSWDLGSEQVLWFRGFAGAPRIGAEPLEPPRVLVSQSCCNPDSFVPVPGGGEMERTPLDAWRLDGFPGLPGTFYMVVEARVGEMRGTGSNFLRTPIYRFEGPPPPVIAADLDLKLSASQSSAAPGDSLTFNVDVTNLGPEPASNAELFLNLPAGFTLTGFSASQGDFNPNDGYWKINDLTASGPGAEAALTLQVTVNPQPPHKLSGEVFAAEFDPNYNNNSAELEIELELNRSDLQLQKVVQPQQALPGDMVKFELQVFNAGPEPATGVVVNNQIPTGYLWLGDDGGGSFQPGTGLWTVGTLPVGGHGMLTIDAQVSASGNFTSIATVSSNSLDPDPDNNLAIVAIDPFTDVSIEISASAASVEIDEVIVFNIIARNLGPMTAQNVTAQVNLPPDFDFLLCDPCSGDFDPASGAWIVGTLDSDGASHPSEANLRIYGMLAEVGEVSVPVTIGSSTLDHVPANNSDAVTVTVTNEVIFSDRFEPLLPAVSAE